MKTGPIHDVHAEIANDKMGSRQNSSHAKLLYGFDEPSGHINQKNLIALMQ